jgi:hypothetical protein
VSRDTTTRKITTGIVVSVGLFAGADSWSHIYHLARVHGQVLATSLSGDVAAALREHGSATFDEHCRCFRCPDWSWSALTATYAVAASWSAWERLSRSRVITDGIVLMCDIRRSARI